jgi:hypothetical protein
MEAINAWLYVASLFWYSKVSMASKENDMFAKLSF